MIKKKTKIIIIQCLLTFYAYPRFNTKNIIYNNKNECQSFAIDNRKICLKLLTAVLLDTVQLVNMADPLYTYNPPPLIQ